VRPGFDPGYPAGFWDLANRPDGLACEPVPGGLASRHARPGPRAPREGRVYNFVTMLARTHRGERVWYPATRLAAVVG
jgi:glycine betaine catabolism A